MAALLLLGATLMTGCGGGGGDSDVLPPPVAQGRIAMDASTTCGLPDFQGEALRQINQARSQARLCGDRAMAAAAPVRWDGRVFSAAAGHALDMAADNYCAHIDDYGRCAGGRLTEEGYRWHAVAENIGGGQRSVAEVVQAWLASPGHCSNLMDPHFLDIGLACARNTSSQYGWYWDLVLARPY